MNNKTKSEDKQLIENILDKIANYGEGYLEFHTQDIENIAKQALSAQSEIERLNTTLKTLCIDHDAEVRKLKEEKEELKQIIHKYENPLTYT